MTHPVIIETPDQPPDRIDYPTDPPVPEQPPEPEEEASDGTE